MRRFLLNRRRLQPCSQVLSQERVGENPGSELVALIRVNTTLYFGWVILPVFAVFNVAIIISSGCYLSIHAFCQPRSEQAYIQASAHHN